MRLVRSEMKQREKIAQKITKRCANPQFEELFVALASIPYYASLCPKVKLVILISRVSFSLDKQYQRNIVEIISNSKSIRWPTTNWSTRKHANLLSLDFFCFLFLFLAIVILSVGMRQSRPQPILNSNEKQFKCWTITDSDYKHAHEQINK